jgi:hypothetical protein
MIEFKPWPKTPRLFRDMVITEKIDGTNAAVTVERWASDPRTYGIDYAGDLISVDGEFYAVAAQSRKRLIRVGDDNFGFAAWVNANATSLVQILGEGTHFGEWWGHGIQRGYGLARGDRRFSLFNVNRYGDLMDVNGYHPDLQDLGVVPVLSRYTFDTSAIKAALLALDSRGSSAAPGFPHPEGVIVFHTAANSVFKVLLENDDRPKGEETSEH